MDINKEFEKFAHGKKGISSLTMHRFNSIYNNYISPTIIEERQLNVISMDVFSRLMMDRIIFIGLPIDDYVANIIQAQLLFLDSVDPAKDIQIYFNTPGGQCTPGLEFTIPFNLLTAMLQLFVLEWLHQWVRCFLLQEQRANVRRSNMHGL